MGSKLQKRHTSAAVQVAAVWPFPVGGVFLFIALVASLALVIEHIAGLALPGCGAGGACEQAADSIWGKVPLIDWPVSFLGLAYFSAALTGWIIARSGLPQLLRWVVRLGALGSAFFCVIIVVEWLFCPYCIASHIANFAFWVCMERSRSSVRRVGPVLAAAVVVFAVVSAGAGTWDYTKRAARAAAAEAERADSAQKMLARLRDLDPQAAPTPPTTAPVVEPATTEPTSDDPGGDEPAPITESPVAPATQESVAAEPPPVAAPETNVAAGAEVKPFTGRWRIGPEAAPIRIMIFTDYQCRDCRRIEKQLEEILHERDDVSLSMKHFPFCQECNAHVSRDMHANACHAARAAEAIGMMYGNDAFWKMHNWLFERGGSFRTTKEVTDGIRSLGYDPDGFMQVWRSDETLERVRADADEGHKLGLFFTPMIFINGIELKGWDAPNALKRTVEQIAATNPPARTAAFDHPPEASEKYVEDWEDEPQRSMPPDKQAWMLGPEKAKVRVVVWGDYQEKGSSEADAVIRAYLTNHPDVSYTFRHYPFNSDCNPNLPYQRHPLACWASRAAEAAGRLAGSDGYWRMHAWLMQNYDMPLRAAAEKYNVDAIELGTALFTLAEKDRTKNVAKLKLDVDAVLAAMQAAADDGLRAQAVEMGLDADLLVKTMDDPDIQANIVDDVEMGKKKLPRLRYGMPPGLFSIPTIFVNYRFVPRWKMPDGPDILEMILDRAAQE